MVRNECAAAFLERKGTVRYRLRNSDVFPEVCVFVPSSETSTLAAFAKSVSDDQMFLWKAWPERQLSLNTKRLGVIFQRPAEFLHGCRQFTDDWAECGCIVDSVDQFLFVGSICMKASLSFSWCFSQYIRVSSSPRFAVTVQMSYDVLSSGQSPTSSAGVTARKRARKRDSNIAGAAAAREGLTFGHICPTLNL
jgi:hypothetical protein